MSSVPPADRAAENCSCTLTEPSTWTTYGSAVEPGSTCEWDPYCPVHGQVAEIRERLDATESVAYVADDQTIQDARWLLSENDRLTAEVEELQAKLDAAKTATDDMRAALERRLLQVRSLRSGGPKKVNPLVCTTPVSTVEDEIEDARVWWEGFDRDSVVQAHGLDGSGGVSDAQ